MGLLAAFALHHSFLARPSIKQIWWKFIPEPFRRATFSHLANFFAYAIVFHWQPIPIVLWQFDYYSSLRIWILVPFAIGWLMLFIGARSFNLAALFGLRQIWFWFKGKPYEPIDVTNGRLYDLARHPEFLGVFAGVWFVADMTVGHLLLASSFTAYSLIALRMKDRGYIKTLGSSYARYCANVPMLGPHWLTATFVGIWMLVTAAQLVHSSAQTQHDQQARADIQQLRQALLAYHAKTGSYPPGQPGSRIADCEQPIHKPQYDMLMASLISAGVLAMPLAHPHRRPQGYGYCHQALTWNGRLVRLVWVTLPSTPLSHTGEPATCRPFEGNDRFCSSSHANHDYCLCLP